LGLFFTFPQSSEFPFSKLNIEDTIENLKANSGSSHYELSNHTSYSQTQTGAAVSL
jgi:hypothetical protein